MQIGKVRSLLSNVSNLKEQDKKLRKIKGEDFNLFSIMRMENNENNTHSNIIGELLNPIGSHNMGDVFLRLFLSIIYSDQKDRNGKLKNVPDIDSLLQSTTPKISIERHIGYKDEQAKTGGRIDILIEFGDQHTITIENKINAPDQKFQLKRYHNFRKGKNDVFYLTKFGVMADEFTADDLTADDIYCISYANDIKKWMQNSIQISAEEPILRESLKQYLILIKKITFQMQDELKQQMNVLLKNDLRTASSIFHSYLDAKDLVKREIKNEVFNLLKPEVKQYGLQILHGGDVNQKFSQIWMYTDGAEKPALSFGIESFSGHNYSFHNGQMMVGINNSSGEEAIAKEIYEGCTEWFIRPEWIPLTNSNNDPLNLDDLNTLDLFLDSNTRQQNIDIIVDTSLQLIKKHYKLVNKINIRTI